MQHLRAVAFIAVLVGVLVTAVASVFNHITYTVESKDGNPAVFSCKEASGGTCFLVVGAENGQGGRRLSVEAGKKVTIPVSAAEDTICYSASADIAWPACLKTEFRQSLKESNGTIKIYFRT